MKSDYVIWKARRIADSYLLDMLVGVENDYKLKSGISFLSTFPSSAFYTVNPDYPYNTLLVDNLPNTDRLIVASDRLKGFLEQHIRAKVEYLPISIHNHKNRPIREIYFIINPLDPIDGLDIEKCSVTWSKIVKDKIRDIKRIVLLEEKIDKERQLFRLARYDKIVLIKKELARKIDEAGFTGIQWVELDKYPED
ncbi:MAG: DUF1629 domain-containing protein [Pedobacter sp.]